MEKSQRKAVRAALLLTAISLAFLGPKDVRADKSRIGRPESCGRDPLTLPAPSERSGITFEFKGAQPCEGGKCSFDIKNKVTGGTLASIEVYNNDTEFCSAPAIFAESDDRRFGACTAEKEQRCCGKYLYQKFTIVLQRNTGILNHRSVDHSVMIQVFSNTQDHQGDASKCFYGVTGNAPNLYLEDYNLSNGLTSALFLFERDTDDHWWKRGRKASVRLPTDKRK